MDPESEFTSDRSVLHVSRRVCPHCSQSVSFKTFKAHKRLYYDSGRDHWLTTGAGSSVHESQCDDEHTTDEAPPSSFGHKRLSDSIDAAPSFSYCDMDDGKCSYRWILAS